jgi:hypothetical protein
MKINVSDPPATGRRLPGLPEGTTIQKFVGAGVTGIISFVAAVFTTVVESGGFWQYFWLGACILFFVCAASLVILAGNEGVRIDRAANSFEPRNIHCSGAKDEVTRRPSGV